jgi:phospholipid/cholesterol/gamma-HCH transport system substrate-binding protein
MRRRQQAPFANPVLVGAVTVLVLMVAVFLAYNANEGLPFVPTRELKVDFADGSNLVVGNDVREGGFQVGFVSELKPVILPSGQVGAQATLKLNKSDGSVPVDSTATVLPKSVLGLKYVALTVGSSKQTYADGATMPIAHTTVPVQFDDVFKTFNEPTRTAIQNDLKGYGDALAARGSALNDTIHSLPSLLGYLRPVAAYLSDPRTQLTRFFDSLNAFMGTVAPVAQTNSQLFTEMATTFGAIARNPHDLEATVAESPSTLDVSTNSLEVQQPFLTDLTTFGNLMQPATSSLRQALPQLDPAIEEGTAALKRTPPLNAKLQAVMDGLKSLALAPGTNVGLGALSATVSTLNPMVRYLGPYQTVCDYWNYWWTYLSEHLSEQTSVGFAQRALLNFADAAQPDNVGTEGATEPADGQDGGSEYFHAQTYGSAIDNQGNADCETGQRGYVKDLNYFDPQHRDLATDQHTPGDQGSTWRGRARVPRGETFSRNPTTGPQTLYNPSNP